MKEKIYEFKIDQTLSRTRRKAIDRFLGKNLSKLKWPSSYKWDEGNEHLLHITVYPVKWEIWFAPRRVTVFGSGPLWAKLLFSDKKRVMLREGMIGILHQLGFMESV